MSSRTAIPSPMVLSPDIVSFEADAFDRFAEEKGITLVHMKAIPCSGSEIDTGDIRSSHQNCACESTGWIYKKAGNFRGVFTNAPKHITFQSMGVIDHATAFLVVPRFYVNNGPQAYFANYDRLEYDMPPGDTSMLVPYWEKININQSGLDRLMFDPCVVEFLVDGSGKEYHVGKDFTVCKGGIKWLGQNRPQFDQYTNKGYTYSIRYLYKPAWYINRIYHETRMNNTFDPDTQTYTQVRYPMHLELIRELYFHTKLNNPKYENIRENYLPPDGANLGPR